jgi:hypothetical protein
MAQKNKVTQQRNNGEAEPRTTHGKRRIGKNAILKDRDVINIVSTQKRA